MCNFDFDIVGAGRSGSSGRRWAAAAGRPLELVPEHQWPPAVVQVHISDTPSPSRYFYRNSWKLWHPVTVREETKCDIGEKWQSASLPFVASTSRLAPFQTFSRVTLPPGYMYGMKCQRKKVLFRDLICLDRKESVGGMQDVVWVSLTSQSAMGPVRKWKCQITVQPNTYRKELQGGVG